MTSWRLPNWLSYGGSEEAYLSAALSSTLYSWARADTYTAASGKAAQFDDRVNAGVGIRAITANHAYAQATAGQRATVSMSATFGRLSAAYVAANAVYYDSSSPASSWRFLHDGTGMQFWFVMRPTADAVQTTLTTRTTSGTGFSLVRGAAGVGFTSFYNLNAASFVIQLNGAGVDWANGTATYRSAKYATADNPDYTVTAKTTTVGSGDQLTAPAAGDSAIPLRIGSDGTNHTDMEWVDLLIYKGAPSAAVASMVQRYILVRYGIS